MLSETEVRIGNIVSGCGGIQAVQAQYIGVADFYSPVPLNENWLVKFGFEKDEELSEELIWVYKKEYLIIDKQDKNYLFMKVGFGDFEGFGEKIMCLLCTGTPRDLDYQTVPAGFPDYVHQLQNLYFAVTGKELID